MSNPMDALYAGLGGASQSSRGEFIGLGTMRLKIKRFLTRKSATSGSDLTIVELECVEIIRKMDPVPAQDKRDDRLPGSNPVGTHISFVVNHAGTTWARAFALGRLKALIAGALGLTDRDPIPDDVFTALGLPVPAEGVDRHAALAKAAQEGEGKLLAGLDVISTGVRGTKKDGSQIVDVRFSPVPAPGA